MESRAGAGRSLVRPFASPARAPRLAFTALHSPWRVRSPYCSGSRTCVSAWVPPEGASWGGLVPWQAIGGVAG